MKNVIKKIAAVAMAFTLLGTGTTIAKTVNPKSVTSLSAHAACNHYIQRSYTGNWQYIGIDPISLMYDNVWYSRPYEDRCGSCGKLINSGTYYRYRKENILLWWDKGDWHYTYNLPY